MRPVLALLLIALAATLALVGPAAATQPAWQSLTPPWTGGVNDLAAFSPSGLAAVADGGKAAVSTDGGLKWTRRSPAAQGITADLRGVAFRDASHGVVVGAAGTLLVTSDGGRTWRTTGVSGPPPDGTLRDVALAGLAGYAVGDQGTLLRTSDGGESWRVLSSPTSVDLRKVAIAGDGTFVVGGADGAVLCGSGNQASLVALADAAVADVAAAETPVWSDGVADLLVSAGDTVLASDDAASFSPLLATPWSNTSGAAVAWLGVPDAGLLLAGSGGAAGFYWLAADAWQTSATGLTGSARAASAPGTQSVAYVLDSQGAARRTLSAGATPSTQSLTKPAIMAGESTRLDTTVRVGAPGSVVLERSVAGGAWTTQESRAWLASGWEGAAAFTLKPLWTTAYRLRFAYGGSRTTIGDTATVVVNPRLTPNKLRIAVSRGTVYRFGGTVTPALPGEYAQLYTDRGGGWHRIDIGGTVRLIDNGKRWLSRQFGTPVRETYHLRAYVGKTKRHGATWSPVVTVVVN